MTQILLLVAFALLALSAVACFMRNWAWAVAFFVLFLVAAFVSIESAVRMWH